MKSSSLLTWTCRACAQRFAQNTRATASHSTTSRLLPSAITALSPSQPSPQQTRRISSSPHHHLTLEPSTEEPALSTPPPSQPSTTTNPLSPALVLSQPYTPTIDPYSPSRPSTIFTATITSIHSRTAHATRNIPLTDKHLRKTYLTTTHDLVHDPYDILRVGDIIRYSAFTAAEKEARTKVKDEMRAHKWQTLKEAKRLVGRRKPGDGKKSKRVDVGMVVRQVVSAWGTGLEERLLENERRKLEVAMVPQREKVPVPVTVPTGRQGGGKGKKVLVEAKSESRGVGESGKGSGKVSIIAALRAREAGVEVAGA